MSVVILELPVVNWYCPSCHATDQTREKPATAYTRMHNCPKVGMLSIPMLQEGVKGKHLARLRDDYVGKELVQYDADGRPVASVETWRDEGQDCVVFAPTATVGVT